MPHFNFISIMYCRFIYYIYVVIYHIYIHIQYILDYTYIHIYIYLIHILLCLYTYNMNCLVLFFVPRPHATPHLPGLRWHCLPLQGANCWGSWGRRQHSGGAAARHHLEGERERFRCHVKIRQHPHRNSSILGEFGGIEDGFLKFSLFVVRWNLSINPNDLPAGAILCSWTGSRSCAAGGPKMPKPAFGWVKIHEKEAGSWKPRKS